VKTREAFINHLAQKGIETMIHYPVPPHRQEAYQAGFSQLSLSITEEIQNTVVSLPISPIMTQPEVEYVVESINHWKS
jgi:dTDP-4-amino-4,6-dideoxygalactose transaminase